MKENLTQVYSIQNKTLEILKRPSLHVSFGEISEIPIERIYTGGYAYNAVKINKRMEGKNQSTKTELMLTPDNFSIPLDVENPARLWTSFYAREPSDEGETKPSRVRSKTM